ncbi:MAG: hypothetical protein PHW72_00745 [Candidatus Pacebacteria bacterium]|nr:hypothetical protein [Candidatus Paceibacterota bacterium]
MLLNNKIKISVALIVFLAVIMAVFLVRPILSGIKASSEELKKQREESYMIESKISSLEDFRTIYNGLEGFLEEIDGLFVDSDVPIVFINFLENKAKDSNLEIKISSNVTKTDKKDFWPFLVFQINAKGSFVNYLKFLHKIENGSYLAEVENVNVLRSGEDNVSASFSVKVFAK